MLFPFTVLLRKCSIDAHGGCLQICGTKAERKRKKIKRDNFTSSKDQKYE